APLTAAFNDIDHSILASMRLEPWLARLPDCLPGRNYTVYPDAMLDYPRGSLPRNFFRDIVADGCDRVRRELATIQLERCHSSNRAEARAQLLLLLMDLFQYTAVCSPCYIENFPTRRSLHGLLVNLIQLTIREIQLSDHYLTESQS
ncbi:MAG: hypothetical protein B7X06_02715, partial [Verrucomicrobia bacterium 21-51-4]